MKLISIGFGNYVSMDKIVTVLSPDSAPIKRMVSDSREKGNLVDASFGRSTKSVLVMNSGHIILSSQTPEDLSSRIQQFDNIEDGV